MRNSIIAAWLCAGLLALAQSFTPTDAAWLGALNVPASGGACATTDTDVPYDEFLEGFQTDTTGTNDGNAWAAALVGTTANIDCWKDTTALSDNKQAGACDRAWYVSLPTDGTETFIRYDRGSSIDLDTQPIDVYFDVWIDTAPDAGESYVILMLRNTEAGSAVARCYLKNNSGTLQMWGNGDTTSTAITVSASTWIPTRMHIATDGDANSYIAIGSTTNTFERTVNDFRWISFGAPEGLDANDSGAFYLDRVCVNSP